MAARRRILPNAAIFFIIVSFALGAYSEFGPSHLSDSLDRASMLSFFLGLAATMLKLQLDVEALARKHAKLIRSVAELDELKRSERVFVDGNFALSNKEKPHVYAYLQTGRTQGVDHITKMAKSFESMTVRNAIDVQDPRLTEEFLRNLVSAIEELGPNCVWIGTSLVYRPEGWGTKEIHTFATAIREKSFREKLKVYRIYIFDSARADIDRIERELKASHIAVEVKNKITVKIHRQTHDFRDISLFCVPPAHARSGQRNDPADAPPFLSWDEFKEKGWRVVFGLKWHIQDGCDINQISVYSGDDPFFVENEYKRFVDLWARAEDYRPVTPDVLPRAGGTSADGEPTPRAAGEEAPAPVKHVVL